VQNAVTAMLRRCATATVVAATALTLAVATPASPALAASRAVQIAAVQYDSPGTDRGSNKSLNAEWVLIRNTSKKARKLNGFTVSDKAGHTYTFGKLTLAAGASVRLHTGKGSNSKKNRYWGSSWYIWNNDGDTAVLRTKKGSKVDSCSWSGGAQKKIC